MQSSFLAPESTAIDKKTEPVRVYSKSYTATYHNATSKFSKRFYTYIYLFSLVFAFLFQARFSLNYHNCLSLFTLKTFFFSLLIFSISIPISIWRNAKFTIWEPTYSSTMAELLAIYTSLDNLLLFLIYIVSSLTIICTYISWIMKENYALDFLLQQGLYLGARQLNQEKVFIYLYSILLGFNCAVDYLSSRSFVIKINNVQQPLSSEIKNSLATVLCKSAMRALYTFGYAYITFAIFNGTIYYYVARLFALNYRVLDSPIVGFRWVDAHFSLRLIVAGILTTSIFNVVNRIYDAVFSKTLSYTDSYLNQFDCLIEGLSKKENDHIKVAAFSELALLSNKHPNKRKELFDKIGYELHESAWHQIMTQCLLVINDIRTKIDIEYNGVRPVVTPVPVEPVEQNISTRLAFSNGPVFTTTTKKKQIYYDDRTVSIFSDASELAEHVSTNIPESKTCVTASFRYLQQSAIVDLIKSLEIKFGYIGLLKPFYSDTVLRRMQKVFNKYQLTIWAIQSIASLTSGSLTEDKYGLVQNNIGQTINTFLGCLIEIENYMNSPPSGYRKLLDEHVVPGEVEAVILALKEAIYQIIETFNKYADDFSIEDKNISKWNSFLKFQE